MAPFGDALWMEEVSPFCVMGIGVVPFDVGIIDAICVEEMAQITASLGDGVTIEVGVLTVSDLKDSSTVFGSSFTLTNSFEPVPKSSFWREEGVDGCLAMWTVRPLRKKNCRPQYWH